MPPISQTSRSLAGLFVLALAAGGCSFSADEAALDQISGGDTYGGNDTGGSTTGTEDTGTEDTGTEGDGGEDAAEPGPEDPDLALDVCDPLAEQVIAYGLELANSEAAPELVASSVLAGDGSVPAIPLSARPFLNHYDFDYPSAQTWEPEISGELWQPPMLNVEAPARYRLQFAILGPSMDPAQRLPVDLAIVVDLGAAMSGEPLELAEEALAALESALIPGDRVTLIAAGAEPILLGTTTIESLGSTPLTGLIGEQEAATLADVGSALELAYTTITPAWDGQGQPRVLLISNGHFDVGAGLTGYVGEQAEDGRYLLSVGVGDPELFDAALVGELAEQGRGAMLFAANANELWLELQQEFTSHLIAAATDLEVTLTLPPGLAVRQHAPYVGDAAEPKLAMLSPNNALVFHHELEACGELDLDAVIRVEAEWTDPLANEAKQAVWEQPVSALGEGSLRGYKGAATVAYARVLRSYRDGIDPTQSYGAVLDAISSISDALEALPEDADLIEMSSVVSALSQ
jgi:hypothetical protein